MKFWKSCISIAVTLLLVTQLAISGRACGPETIQPVYVFRESGDPPFDGFVQGNIGIVRNTFGRKTLFIAYNYLVGHSFTGDEQHALVEALKGTPPEKDDDSAIKEWIAARKEVVHEESPPEIYQDRRNQGFDYFPNCTKNAFEVATETLADRVARNTRDDPSVQEWLRGQDLVFENCGAPGSIPPQLSSSSPEWLRKDRDYQVGAALFYQLKFDAARQQFEKIASDYDSPWQQTARYLVARTLVREASLNQNEKLRQRLDQSAEVYVTNLLSQSGQFQNATLKLLALIKYRLHPEERVRELAQVLSTQSGNENLRQDLIDYAWLVDKFDEQVRQQEEKRKKGDQPQPPPPAYNRFATEDEKREYEAIERGELIQIWFSPLKPDGQLDYTANNGFTFPFDATESTILQAVESDLGRKLTAKENDELKDRHESALQLRRWRVNPNQKWPNGTGYEGCFYPCTSNQFDLIPSFLRLDDLTDWMFTFQADDLKSLQHAISKWKQSHSLAWLVSVLSHANKTTPGIQRFLNQAESVPVDSPAYATLAFHRVRLLGEFGNKIEARKLLEQILNAQSESLPISTRNQFLQQRMALADSLPDFLRYAARKPVTYYEYGTYGSISQILDIEKDMWGDDYIRDHQDEYNQEIESLTRKFLPWQERIVFDDETAEMMNWHFSTAQFLDAAHDSALPDYLRRQFLLNVWTRAILLKDEATAMRITSELITTVPEMSDLLRPYLTASTARERNNAALFVFLKFPNLTPFVVAGIPEFNKSEETDYYLESAWWCPLSSVEYDDNGNEAPRKVPGPQFLAAPLSLSAERERAALNNLGSAKSYLGKKVLAWARQAPDDPRIPEALFIALKANEGYKYGCESWEHNEEITKEAETLLRGRYANTEWTVKLNESKEEP